MTAEEIARLVVRYAYAHGLEIGPKANALWDACESVLGDGISGSPSAIAQVGKIPIEAKEVVR